MNTCFLDEIDPPHEVRDQEQYQDLVDAYRSGVRVSPPVVLAFGHRKVALSGSHRIAAMRKAFPGFDGESVEDLGLILVLDGNEVYETIEASGYGYPLLVLDRLLDGELNDYCEAVCALYEYLPERAQLALDDQY